MKKVLIIDDMSFNIAFVEQALSELSFNGVIQKAMNLKEARERLMSSLKEGRFDLIVSDLNLPDGQFTTLLTILKQKKSFSSIPIILMTTNEPSNLSSVLEAIDVGVTDYFFKPSDVSEIVAKIKKHCPDLSSDT